MSKKRPSHSERVRDDADIIYEVALPFHDRNAEIMVIDTETDVEIVVANIPTPATYHLDYDNNPTRNQIMDHAVARWIVDDAARILDPYNWNLSSSRSRSGNYYLKDIYFTCDRESVDQAVMDAKKFLTNLEQQILNQSQEAPLAIHNPPSEELDTE